MIFPDYKNSIVNVSSSIIAALGGRAQYPPLKKLAFLKQNKKIVLLVVDGLGYEFLKKYGQDSFLEKNCVDKITSVFPTTTASAETSLETGVAPKQHAITGFTMWLKELGVVSKILLFNVRGGGSLMEMGVSRDDIYTEKVIMEKVSVPSVMVMPRIAAARFGSSRWAAAFDDLPGMIDQIKKAVSRSDNRFVYSYWIDLDKTCHKYGCASNQAKNHLIEIDRAIEDLAGFLKKREAILVVTADHGLCDVLDKNRIILQDYPDIYDCLALPLCGDSRASFCYVRPERDREFRRLVKKKLDFCCTLHKGSDFIKKGVFGLGVANPRLYERVGDYILVAKDGYTIRDFLFREAKPERKGHHGGLSEEEIYVPLIVSR